MRPYVFAALVLVSVASFRWPLRWIVSGAPMLFYAFVLGEAHGYRILPHIPLWTIFTTLNLAYVICATSWLFYWLFAAACYPIILLTCIWQFEYSAGLARRAFRTLSVNLHFIHDKVAFFDLPALEIDKDVNGLFVIRGATLSLSTLTLVAHGVEVGIKLSDDMELAIQVEDVTVSLLRRIEVGDVYANVKGGDWEMTFGSILPEPDDPNDVAVLVEDTPILRAAAMAIDGSGESIQSVKAKADITGGKPPKDESRKPKSILQSITQISPDENNATEKYQMALDHISKTCGVSVAKEALRESSEQDESTLDYDNINDLRAAICAHIHDQPSVPHPPKNSVRLSTLRKTDYPAVKKFLHRLPLLYRLMLSPICYFHPVHFKSITAAGSGKWFVHLMQKYFFKHYSELDPNIRRLENRISAWLAEANFAVELSDINCTAQYPIDTNYDIEAKFKFGDFMAYRTLPMAVNLVQVVRLGGADASMNIPIFLFPHHEHIMPSRPTTDDEEALEKSISDLEGTPHQVHAQTELEQLRKDEANIKISAHAHLPARFHQDLLNFIAALVKATKVIETDKDFEELKSLRELRGSGANASDLSLKRASSVSQASSIASTPTSAKNQGFKNFLKKVDTGFKEAGTNMRDGMRKAGLNTASAVANDRWIAKLVGKVLLKLEKAQGDVGYSGAIPVSLEPYRERAEDESKILP
ncbi:hypothetical protein BDV96DRAFT_499899 [Lophiotrema nucula]|uniref:Uncharacterized protein n=1 Tax=Lophiotrema nucula TaxID=690887 RepID=A0A6A5YY49_9PLEO|nr:hypothetical protein BDV96DRAFT_499899 [Lophiotrema nucula]